MKFGNNIILGPFINAVTTYLGEEGFEKMNL